MKNISILILFFLFSVNLFAQETAPNYLLYRYNMNLINPAYAGANGAGALNLGFRKQAMDLEDEPVTQMASYSQSFGENVGLGLSLVNDKVFVSKQTDVAVDFSYKLQMAPTTNLYLGLKAGFSMYNIDFNSLGLNNDPLFGENVSTSSPLVGVGAYLKGSRYYVHLSSPNLLLSEVQKPTLGAGQVEVEGVSEKLHLYIGGGYRFKVSNDLDLTPAVFSRIVSDETALIDLSVTADISNNLELGLSHRLNSSFIGSFLLKVTDKTHFGYAYEATISELNTVATGTHEFIVRFNFN